MWGFWSHWGCLVWLLLIAALVLLGYCVREARSVHLNTIQNGKHRSNT
jgi:hypothetical protein